MPDVMELAADCSQCFALCCVVPAFAASADFAITKAAGTPCPNLAEGFGCGIHSELRVRGFGGCTAYDCFGAGQRVAQVTFGGVSWRSAPETAAQMYAAFPVMRELHEFLWYLVESEALTSGRLRAEAVALIGRVDAVAAGSAVELAAADLTSLRADVGGLLDRVSAAARQGLAGQDLSRRDLVGADLRRHQLRGASLRSALLIGADLRGVDLSRADLLGADLRAARLDGADLATALFLTGPQVASATGDLTTRLPPRVTRAGAGMRA